MYENWMSKKYKKEKNLKSYYIKNKNKMSK